MAGNIGEKPRLDPGWDFVSCGSMRRAQVGGRNEASERNETSGQGASGEEVQPGHGNLKFREAHALLRADAGRTAPLTILSAVRLQVEAVDELLCIG